MTQLKELRLLRLFEWYQGGSRIIFRVLQSFTKKNRNDVICIIIIDSARWSFDYSKGTGLKVQFDSSKKHPGLGRGGGGERVPPHVKSTLKLDGYGWQRKNPHLFTGLLL